MLGIRRGRQLTRGRCRPLLQRDDEAFQSMSTTSPDQAVFTSCGEAGAFGPMIFALYRLGLDRTPDEAGLAGLVLALRRGMSWRLAAAGILDSEEFRQRTPSAARVGAPLVRHLGASLATDDLPAALQSAEAGASPAALLEQLAHETAARDAVPLFTRLYPGGARLGDAVAYRLWIDSYDTLTEEAAAAIRLFPMADASVSICMALGSGPVLPALRSIGALRKQIAGRWQLCLAAEQTRQAALREGLLRAGMPPVELVGTTLEQAIEAATGDFLTVLEPGDTLAPDTLAELSAALWADPALDMVFADEDRISPAGERSTPRFKPGWSPESLQVSDSVGNPFFLRRTRISQPGTPLAMKRQVGLARPQAVRHIPAILMHCAAPTPLESRSVPAIWPTPAPRVSIIIPTRDRADLLGPCIEGILHRTDHQALEILLVDTGSEDPVALALLDRLSANPRIRILNRPGPFNWSAANNDAAAEAKGEVLLFLNNDTVVVHPGWLGELAGQAMQPGVGVVGARLLYADGRLQHGGIALGPAGRAIHIQRFAAGPDPGYLGQLAMPRRVGAVTGACLAMPRSVFQALGGFEAEHLTLEWSDIEICIRARARGLRVLWTPHATLTHLESATRSGADDPDRTARSVREQGWVMRLWPEAMENDPFLNPNLLATDDEILIAPKPRQRRAGRSV